MLGDGTLNVYVGAHLTLIWKKKKSLINFTFRVPNWGVENILGGFYLLYLLFDFIQCNNVFGGLKSKWYCLRLLSKTTSAEAAIKAVRWNFFIMIYSCGCILGGILNTQSHIYIRYSVSFIQFFTSRFVPKEFVCYLKPLL